jgi:multicomponent Na+:H+ antiporter subunit D
MTELLLNPALVFIAGAALLPALRGTARNLWLLAVPAAALVLLCWLPHGDHGALRVFGMALNPLRLDKLSFVFGVIFHLAALLTAVYAWHLRDTLQQVAALVYAGAAVGALLAGDLVTLFVWWEITAIASVFLIWARRTERTYRVGLRYLAIQVTSGLLLLTGVILFWQSTGAVAFDRMDLAGPAAWLIFLAFGIKCAFPLLHNWLQDAYPEATVTGTVVLSVYTTKLAVYALARGFPGTEELIWIGAAMALFPVFFAVIENDLRRVLSYSLNSQLGFMVCGVGIGTELALNGAVAHAFAGVLYQALLFMAMGAVLFRTGTVRASELGGLYKSMPWTAGFCIIGSLSISAFPLMAGFVTKSMILVAAAEEGRWRVWLALLAAATAAVYHSGIKTPFFSFFARDSGKRCAEAPPGMLIAMGLAAALCLGLGAWPQPLYALLPHAVDFQPYTLTHVVTQLQLLLFAAAAFAFLYRRGGCPPEVRGLNLDSDWLYRRLLPAAARGALAMLTHLRDGLLAPALALLRAAGGRALAPVEPAGWLASPWSTSTMVGWVTVLLALYLAIALF